jgi:hypothetical protein
MPGDMYTFSVSPHYQTYTTDVTVVALGANNVWLGIRTGAAGSSHTLRNLRLAI